MNIKKHMQDLAKAMPIIEGHLTQYLDYIEGLESQLEAQITIMNELDVTIQEQEEVIAKLRKELKQSQNTK